MCVRRPSNSALVIEESNLGEEITSQETNKDQQNSDDSGKQIEFVPDHCYWIEWQVQRKECCWISKYILEKQQHIRKEKPSIRYRCSPYNGCTMMYVDACC